MIDFIHKLEKKFNTKIIQSDELIHGTSSFDLDKDGNIKHLYLYKVGLRNLDLIEPIAENLIDLTLEGCDLESLGSIQNFKSLVRFELSFNKISDSTLKNIGNLNKLRELQLDYTSIEDTSPLGELINLERLHLNDCDDLKAVKGLQNLKNLSYLNLSSTFVNSIDKIDVRDSLNFLSLRDTVISRISGLDRFPSLKELEITGQSISKIEGLEKSISLNRLNVSTTCISKIEGLEQLVNLEILDLHCAQIEKIEGLDTLVSLKKLNLSENNIRKVENLGKLTNLEYILLDVNRIKEFDLFFLDSLPPCFISLVGNPIKKLDGSIPDHVKIQFETDHWVPRGI
ncbi:Internalin-A precursor [compost metagenome]